MEKNIKIMNTSTSYKIFFFVDDSVLDKLYLGLKQDLYTLQWYNSAK